MTIILEKDVYYVSYKCTYTHAVSINNVTNLWGELGKQIWVVKDDMWAKASRKEGMVGHFESINAVSAFVIMNINH